MIRRDPPRIAYQGEPGAWSELALRRWGGEAAVAIPCRSVAEVGRQLRDGRADLAVLPVHNSLTGPIGASLTLIRHDALRTVGEIELPIRQCLLALAGTRLGDVHTVMSHPVALAQCRRFLRSLSGLRVHRAHDTAGAARRVAAGGDAGVAAIASERAGSHYGLTLLAAGIEDAPGNVTTFRVTAPESDARGSPR